MKIRATAKWSNLCIPSPFGILKRPYGSGPFSVPSREGNWLIKSKYAVSAEESSIEEESLGEIEEIDKGEGESQPEETEQEETPSENQPQTDLVEFLNASTTVEEITEAITGIGSATAQKLIEAQPLTWEKVSGILNTKQQQLALSKFS